jgi:REP-associated tyrosine transposase
MPNHVHLLITVDFDITIERAVQLIKGGFSFQAGKLLGIKAPFWQKSFSEVRILDSDSFENHRRYIHNNPVKAHLVDKAEEHPFSSASPTLGLDPMPDRLKPAFSAESYAIG